MDMLEASCVGALDISNAAVCEPANFFDVAGDPVGFVFAQYKVFVLKGSTSDWVNDCVGLFDCRVRHFRSWCCSWRQGLTLVIIRIKLKELSVAGLLC